MSDVIIYDRMAQRRGTLAAAVALNEILRDGEFFVVRDLSASPPEPLRFKVGDGVTRFNDLNWCGIGAQPDPGEDRFAWWNNAAKDYELKKTLPATNGGTGQTAYTVGDILYASSTTALSKLAAGTIGYVIQSAGPGNAPFWAPSGSSGGLTLLGTVTVTGAAATSMSISGLDLSAYRAFYIEYAWDNATGSSANVSMTYNSDTTATNYYQEGLTVSGAAATAARSNNAIIDTLPANEPSTGRIHISNDRDGRPRSEIFTNRGAISAIEFRKGGHGWTSATNVTGITFTASVASAFAIGSTVRIWGLS